MIENKSLAGTRIGVFGKGGSGKSTFVVLLARALCKRGYRVYVLDADSTNIGLAQALGVAQAPAPLLDYFGGLVFSGGLVTCPVDDPTPLANAQIVINDISSRYYARSPEGITLLVAGKIAGRGPGAGCDGPVAKIARDFQLKDEESTVTLIDFKAGFEDSARGALTSLDWVIVVVDPTTASVELAASMQTMVTDIRAGGLPATRHLENPELVAIANALYVQAAIKGVLLVLNKIPGPEIGDYLTARLAEKGLKPVGRLRDEPSIASSWLRGLPVESAQGEDQFAKIINELEAVTMTDVTE
jgi:CO dehydrogenase nickel-insertion accessory protein CooC1